MHHIKKLVYWNQSSFVKKEASIAITTRARLRNRFLKNRNTVITVTKTKEALQINIPVLAK